MDAPKWRLVSNEVLTVIGGSEKAPWVSISLPYRCKLCARRMYKQKKHLHNFYVSAFFTGVENSGVEPLTSCLPGKRSSQLS